METGSEEAKIWQLLSIINEKKNKENVRLTSTETQNETIPLTITGKHGFAAVLKSI